MGGQSADIGLIGLAVMGENLALNMERRGFHVAVYNRTSARVDEFIAGRGRGRKFIGARTLRELVQALRRPRLIMMMIKAGAPVDQQIDQLLPLLERGDILIDGGNSLYTDTMRRLERVEAAGMLYVGCGVSGGEEGALTGPSLMPGGSASAWPQIRPLLQAICARTPEGEPCAEWMGAGGAGHFVKMVHNGVEYGDMQLIGETYGVMKHVLQMSNAQMRDVFDEWNRGELDSYLIQITRDILGHVNERGEAVLDSILDAAGQKGSGKWTVIEALEQGAPLSLVGEAVFARSLSAAKEERVAVSKLLTPDVAAFSGEPQGLLDDLRQALYAAKIISYTQGFQLLRAAELRHGWGLDHSAVAQVWRAGCIIRSAFLADIRAAFQRDSQLVSLLFDDFFRNAVGVRQAAWRRAVSVAVSAGAPTPCLSSALAWFDSYRMARLPANLLQAQRDYFGAHTYERIDRPRGEYFHTDWTGRGGATTSGSYSA
ncbi:MAG TPA: decarboxylating NADP(+)-dependent phosphogluconate dehydrogenase [Steroidobacter sp.]|nr:decarboxylating NADP(+)-dependent phosphogluconate dehydrogenase [Steroidobacter sp.]